MIDIPKLRDFPNPYPRDYEKGTVRFSDELMKPHPGLTGCRRVCIGDVSIIDGPNTSSGPGTYAVLVLHSDEQERGYQTADQINELLDSL